MKSIMQEDERCYLCRRAIGTETHHVFPGKNRKNSDKDGLTVRLCHECHWIVHFDSHDDGRTMMNLKKEGQKAWEACYFRDDAETTRQAFMDRYGRNYL